MRFGTAYLGSAAMAGRFDPSWLARVDEDGVALADLVASPAAPGEPPLGYAEVHIEQGPELERLGEPLGVVTAIAGQSHAAVTFVGQAGHAGTVPMGSRRDALAGAAEWVLEVERAGPVATVGELRVDPGARNVIPGAATLTLDLRDPRRRRAARRGRRAACARGGDRRPPRSRRPLGGPGRRSRGPHGRAPDRACSATTCRTSSAAPGTTRG